MTRMKGLTYFFAFSACLVGFGCGDEPVSDESRPDSGERPEDDEADAGARGDVQRDVKGSSERTKDAGTSPTSMKRADDAGSGKAKPSSKAPAADDADAGGEDKQDKPDAKVTVAGDIETVAMDVDYTTDGVGVYPIPRPTILFKDGSACRDMNFVVRGLSVADHKKMYPNTWLQWREVDSKIQVGNGMKWRVLDFQQRYAPNPSSFTLDQTYTHLTSVSTVDSSAFAQQSVRFTKDHKMLWGSVASVSTPNGSTSAIPPDRRGSYHIDGYVMEISWDDGKSTKTSLVWSAEDPKAVYIGGAGYVATNSP